MKGLQRNRLEVWLFELALRVANALAALPNRLTPPPFRLIQMSSGYWLSRALYVAARLGIADALGDGRKSSHQLADELGVVDDHLYRLMRMLAANGVFREVAPKLFMNSPHSHCLRRDHPQSVRAMVLMHNSKEMAEPWFAQLESAIRDGNVAFAESHGSDLFAYMDQHPQFDALFAEAMESVEALTGLDYLQDFDWGDFGRIIDVGGSKGKKALAILEAQPHLKALVYDRPQVVDGAAGYWQEKVPADVLSRVEFVGGDMLHAIPAAESDRDLYLFVAVFHGMGDEEAATVLTRLGEAMGKYQARAVIVDMVLPPMGADASLASFDMQMLVNTHGRERTLDEWHRLFAASGYAIDEVVSVRTFAKMLVISRS